MCGIAGFINFSNGEELAVKANEIQKHRGPDNQQVWTKGVVSFAHQRLSIIDLNERSNQPLEKDSLVIIYNGELYNYLELRKKYLSGVKFKTDSDTEVILEMYKLLGKDSLNHFIGMFSFVIYDLKNNKLFGARDHFGIKPFYYKFLDNKFSFASELKTLAKLVDKNKKINKKALISSLNYLWIPGNDSIFEDIFKLPPAHYFYLDINSLDLNIKQYWKIEDNTSKLSEKDLIIKLEKLFNDSVNRHMVSDVPVGSFLSGGLDSSMISVAAGKLSKKLSTYTIGTSYRDKKIESMPDDQKYAKIIAELNNFDHNEIVLSSDIIKILPEIVKTLDEPIGDPAAINTFLICQKAREKGAKVILSGMGADEIFCGYRRQKALIYSKTYKKIPASMRIVISNIARLIPVRLGSHGLRIFRWLKKFLSFAELPLEEAYRMSYSYYSKDELNKLLKDDANEIINSIYNDHYKIFSKYYQSDFINQMCYTDIINFMNGLNLTYTDRASMAASVEVRVPFIDKELISFAMTIPGKYKFKSGNSKYILKKIAEKLLPKKIIYRPKASFGAPIRSWISNDLSDMVDKCLSKEQIEKRGIFDYNYINKIINDDRKGLKDNAYQIYQLLTIELWFKEYID